MNRSIVYFFFFFLFELADTNPTASQRHEIYLPMKKDHKYGDDICYYREIDEKLDYAVYYVKPCEKGQYCEDEVSNNQPFGFCRDILDKPTNFPSYGDACSSDAECQDDLYCDGTCKLKCPSGAGNVYQTDINSFSCKTDGYKKIDANQCTLYEPKYTDYDTIKYFNGNYDTYDGKYPGLPKECGIIRYTTITDYDTNPFLVNGQNSYHSFTRYIKQSEEWCSIGEAKDGDFVFGTRSWRFCKSGFTLKFYRNGLLDNPSYYSENNPSTPYYNAEMEDMCVTPIEIDLSNPLAGCVITYKIGDGNEQKYNADKYGITCDEKMVIKSQIYTQFIEAFNDASEEDKKNCYLIPQNNGVGDCQNLKLLKLYYFYNNHINDYLFYKDREKLEKVLDFKIQKLYHRYYQSSTYLNLNFLLFLLILILL